MPLPLLPSPITFPSIVLRRQLLFFPVPNADQTNLAIQMSRDFAKVLNYTDCWICQQMPAHLFSLQNLAVKIANSSTLNSCLFHPGIDRCFRGMSPSVQTMLGYLNTQINSHYLPKNISTVTIELITYWKPVPGKSLGYTTQSIHSQTAKGTGSTTFHVQLPLLVALGRFVFAL